MVGSIDIRRLNLDELLGVISIYPWYAGARAELCARMAEAGSLSGEQVSQAALYMGSRRILSRLVRAGQRGPAGDRTLGETLRKLLEEKDVETPKTSPEPAPASGEPRIIVVGGDYFSTAQYREARREEDGLFSGFARSERTVGAEAQTGEVSGEALDFCTETLARIYAEQGYFEQAADIYSRLGLRYPEKSVYFASLIEKLDKN